jgi:hypothetical protein
MIAALALSSVAPRAPQAEPSPPVAVEPNNPVASTTNCALRTAQPEAPVTIAESHKRVRATSRTGALARPGQEASAHVIAFVESDEVMADIQRPEAIDVFADPAPVSPPCLVEAPAHFLVQFEKMVEDSL